MDKSVIITIILSIIASGGFWTFLQFTINRKDKKQQMIEELTQMLEKLSKEVGILKADLGHNNEQMNLQNEAIKAQARDRIIWLCKYYRNQGYCSLEDFEVLDSLAESYRKLNGNGRVKLEMNALIKELKIPVDIKED